MSFFQQPNQLNRILDTSIRQVEIKPIKHEPDLEWVLSYNRKLIFRNYKKLDNNTRLDLINLISDLTSDHDLYPETNCLILYHQNKIVGAICSIDHEDLQNIFTKKGFNNVITKGITSNFVFIYNLVIACDYRKNGYANYLLDTLIRFTSFSKTGFDVEIDKSNYISIKIFQKKGFIPNITSIKKIRYLKWIDK